MAPKLILSKHLPRRSRRPAALAHPQQPEPSQALSAERIPPPTCPERTPQPRSWPSQAWREGVLVTLLTTLLTAAVLAAPDAFSQSPTFTWRQLIAPALATGQWPGPGSLVDCP
ncbi:MAG: hypothetical protein ACKOYK_13575 [Cyanobium sp.]